MTGEYIQINSRDNTAVALKSLQKGASLRFSGKEIMLRSDIPRGHKFALSPISKGGRVIKYGYSIGLATADISVGEHVHSSNMSTGLKGNEDYFYNPACPPLTPATPGVFQGYKREDGKTGTRNEIWIIPTVGCSNALAGRLERMSQGYVQGNIDAVTSFPHPFGCSQTGADQENTRRILASLAKHPNAGGVLVIGLGCENTNISVLREYLGDFDEKRIRFLNMQDSADELEEGLDIIAELVNTAAEYTREPVSCSELVIGLKCGGSDGLSGLTANPLTGAVSDLLIAGGGTAVLTEVPEMFGAEQILMNRCTNESVFNDTVTLIHDFKEYYLSQGEAVHKNPAPGNIEGGITTLEEKSLGCVQKAGSAPVAGVIEYGGQIEGKGLYLLNGPGNDIVSTTALAAAGAQIILFTTGRGTPLGTPVPTVKISSNSPLFENKPRWIDFNAGVMAQGASIDETARKLFSLVTEVASGKKTRSEEAGYHDIAIFKTGVTL